jgi:cyanosortase A-associated protein
MSVLVKLRLLGIILASAGTVTVLGRTLLMPVPIEPAPTAVKLPGESHPPVWEPMLSEPDPNFPNTTRFHYSRGEPAIELEMQFIPDLPVHYIRNSMLELRFLPRGHLPLDAGMRFYVNSRGRIIANLRTDPPSEELVDARETSPRSGYGIWTAGQRLHLSTIVTPAGDTAMATRRVARSLYVDHVSLSRVWQWLLGRAMLPDRRCVLVHFSIPAPAPAASGEGRRILEEAWSEWQRAFQPVFSE